MSSEKEKNRKVHHKLMLEFVAEADEHLDVSSAKAHDWLWKKIAPHFDSFTEAAWAIVGQDIEIFDENVKREESLVFIEWDSIPDAFSWKEVEETQPGQVIYRRCWNEEDESDL